MIDTKDPRVQRLVLANLVDMHEEAGRADPKFQVLGKQWYGTAQNTIEQAVKRSGRMQELQRAHYLAPHGITAAVSPAMDWDVNTRAIDDLTSINDDDWKIILASVGKERSTDVQDIMARTSLPSAKAHQLAKVHRILEGEDPEEVLNPQHNPKTWSFMHNTAGNFDPVTIDYRANDIAANMMQSIQGTNRGIGSSQLKGSATTRYEDLGGLHHEAARLLSHVRGEELLGPHIQATNWIYGKHVETHGYPTKSGRPRSKQGTPRRGQPYLFDRPSVFEQVRNAAPAPADLESLPFVVGRTRAQRRGL